ncbi:FUSC family protein [Streptomyces sp. NPDC048664]|uniref:FUSC family protein n=1 Tax=Streptomyces sp. NPDC048664 TaxID=3154505 RepID=UPI00341C6C4C
MSSTAPGTPRRTRVHPLPLSGLLRPGRPSEIWFKPALSVAAAVAPPNLALLALGRLDLAVYTMAGSLCALYAHHRPYAARARVLAAVALGMLGGLAVALVTASLTTDAVLLVTVGALLAAGQKALCDVTVVGPPGNVIFTFVSSAALFAPQSLGQVPAHLALAAAAGAWAWLVGMAPGLLRPYGPERRATASALSAAAAFVETGTAGARAEAAAAVHGAWRSLLTAGAPTGLRHALGQLVVRAEIALAAPLDSDPERLRSWARALRGTAGEQLGAADERDERDPRHRLSRPTPAPSAPAAPAAPRTRWSSVAPLALRTALGCASAGYASLALGVGRPYWALVTAASLYQANVTLTWSRGVQRVVGNLAGVLLFAALAPLAHASQAALVLCGVALAFGAEALISRNYWLGSVCVTPMALFITEFGHPQEPGALMTDRVLDCVLGALVGLVAAIAVTNRRAGHRLERALDAVEVARGHAVHALAAEHPDPGALEAARRHLAAAVVELRATADTAAGEWWLRALPEERVRHVEQAGHRTLAEAVRRQGPHTGEGVRV